MNDVVISARSLGKSYQIGHQLDRSLTFREQIMAAGSAFRRNFGRTLRGEQILAGDEVETFWALKDVDFDICRGDVVGVIGRNGAGKSTLLKVLSRITEPTTGRVEIRGRVASLLEVGTGFHPELTGRENIFLNGAILGMTRAEIRKKFDEIVDFAGVEKFIDTPVKRYSSGMYVRLAFSVAAHLEPEILIVDEVLAVGDAEFQKKCLGKMQDVAGQGRTVLFVSHNMGAVTRLCRTGMWFNNGNLFQAGEVSALMTAYLGTGRITKADFPMPSDPNSFHISRIEVLDPVSQEPTSPQMWDPVLFRVHFHSPEPQPNAAVEFYIYNEDGTRIFRTSTRPDMDFDTPFRAGSNSLDLLIDCLMLSEGSYTLGGALTIPNVRWLYQEEQGAILTVKAKIESQYTIAPSNVRNGIPFRHRWQKQVQGHLARGSLIA